MLRVCLHCGGSGAEGVGVVGVADADDGDIILSSPEAMLSSLLLLKTAAAASSHVGIGGIFDVDVVGGGKSGDGSGVSAGPVLAFDVVTGVVNTEFVNRAGLLLASTLSVSLHICFNDAKVVTQTLRMRWCSRNFLASEAVPW